MTDTIVITEEKRVNNVSHIISYSIPINLLMYSTLPSDEYLERVQSLMKKHLDQYDEGLS